MDIGVEIEVAIVRLWNLVVVLKLTASTLASVLCILYILFQMLFADLLRNNAKKASRSSKGHQYHKFKYQVNKKSSECEVIKNSLLVGA